MSTAVFYLGNWRRSRPRLIMWLIIGVVAALFVWARYGTLDEVAVGEGKVTPSNKSLKIQSLDGGILTELFVHEGNIVEAEQKLATLDPVLAQSSVGEARARIAILRAKAARIEAEMNNRPAVVFPPDLQAQADRDILAREVATFRTNRSAYQASVGNLEEENRLAQQELKMVEPYVESGAANQIEVLRLRQKAADLNTRLSATRNQYYVALKDEYGKVTGELGPLIQVEAGRADKLNRTVINAPARGIVKDISTTTTGGVIAPGGLLMEIVPLEDQLLIEAHISPRDIAFIHAGQKANIKITAYDSSIYGTLDGSVETISPDTITDDVDRRVHYYRVYIRTQRSYLETSDGKQHPIMPGMVVTAEIRTGTKTVFDYLIKPLHKAAEALRER
ncbi:MAG: HlyD family efflux transporter periplasmic adaptor subunit [Desulfovibrionaceae bacterium]|nr:HlyD family efflux transporter periplasmic adaptor subunit [Desulfovibrionaceae bacterium]